MQTEKGCCSGSYVLGVEVLHCSSGDILVLEERFLKCTLGFAEYLCLNYILGGPYV